MDFGRFFNVVVDLGWTSFLIVADDWSLTLFLISQGRSVPKEPAELYSTEDVPLLLLLISLLTADTGFLKAPAPAPVPAPRRSVFGFAFISLHLGMCLSAAFSLKRLWQ